MTEFDTSAIELTEQERRLLDSIEVDARALKHENARHNGDLACEMMNYLLLRNAIPKARMDYFTRFAIQRRRPRLLTKDHIRKKRNTRR